MTNNIACECGGALHRQQVPEFDFSRYVGGGVQVILQNPPAWVCDTCHGVTLDGELINAARQMVIHYLIKIPERFGSDLAKLVRRLIGLTQQELAERMGIHRVTIADWERGDKELSAQHDLLLRSIAFGVSFEASETVAMPIQDRQLIGKALASVRKGSQVRNLASLSPMMIAEAVTCLPRAS